MEPFELLETERGPEIPLFEILLRRMRNPRNSRDTVRLVLHSSDWVNVVARTVEGRWLMVRQYRSGVNRLTIEIPGGALDSGETHQEAAARELREETGFTSSQWTYLGAVEPNPAIHNHLCHHWLAEEAIQEGKPQLDAGEDIQVFQLTQEQLRKHFQDGELRHALALSALSRVSDLWTALTLDT